MWVVIYRNMQEVRVPTETRTFEGNQRRIFTNREERDSR